jgi:hypothetical protein
MHFNDMYPEDYQEMMEQKDYRYAKVLKDVPLLDDIKVDKKKMSPLEDILRYGDFERATSKKKQ